MLRETKILVANGPNLDILGRREPEIYGTATLSDIEALLRKWLKKKGVDACLEFFQTNSEGELISKLNSSHGKYSGLIINPGALSHYSLALLDSLKAFPARKVEVHISNPLARGGERSRLLTAQAMDALFLGVGVEGYVYALSYLLAKEGLLKEI